MSYRKRDIAHWNQGKAYKGTRKAKERAYVQNDIETQIQEERDENFRYRHYSHKPNREARLKHLIEWYESRVAQYEREPKASWRCAFASYARDALRRAKKQLRELQEKKNVVRPQ